MPQIQEVISTSQRLPKSTSPGKSWPYVPPKPRCEYCQDVHFVRYDYPVGHPRFGLISPCPKCNQKAIDAACGLKTHERAVTLDKLITVNRPGAQAMKRAGLKFLANPVGFLSVYGPCGNAKTILLQAIVNACLASGIEARYLTAHELMDYLKEAFDPHIMETDIGRIRRLANIPVLAIDEMDKAKNTEYSADMQQHLINERYRNANVLGTVFAWNGTLDTLPWPAVVSRISEYPHIENKDEDLRPAIGAAK
jgi:chromosomal replication initiation ATPase DnaA